MLVQPAFFCSGFDHGVFARDLVNGDRKVRGFTEITYHIEVESARFDHEHICAFGFIEVGFVKAFYAVARVYLVGFFIVIGI